MERREFLRAGLAVSAAGLALGLVGCADETKQTGTTVEMTPEDLQGFEAAEASYRAMEKGAPKAKKKQ